jgi:hypothetical protein
MAVSLVKSGLVAGIASGISLKDRTSLRARPLLRVGLQLDWTGMFLTGFARCSAYRQESAERRDDRAAGRKDLDDFVEAIASERS